MRPYIILALLGALLAPRAHAAPVTVTACTRRSIVISDIAMQSGPSADWSSGRRTGSVTLRSAVAFQAWRRIARRSAAACGAQAGSGAVPSSWADRWDAWM